MHVLVVNFQLDGLPRDQYEQVCNELAPTFAAIPGLVSKHWLANDETGTYGGVYVFESHQAFLDYQASELFASVAGNPAFADISAKDFGILAGPSAVTGVS
ncbi:MAG: YdhR family protein [Planctomycetota bacterium]|nr:YdhR family protein [Planctomycetota bacterium]MDG1985106.1 YdhR family protein [Planctomycetota bacterium]